MLTRVVAMVSWMVFPGNLGILSGLKVMERLWLCPGIPWGGFVWAKIKKNCGEGEGK